MNEGGALLKYLAEQSGRLVGVLSCSLLSWVHAGHQAAFEWASRIGATVISASSAAS